MSFELAVWGDVSLGVFCWKWSISEMSRVIHLLFSYSMKPLKEAWGFLNRQWIMDFIRGRAFKDAVVFWFRFLHTVCKYNSPFIGDDLLTCQMATSMKHTWKLFLTVLNLWLNETWWISGLMSHGSSAFVAFVTWVMMMNSNGADHLDPCCMGMVVVDMIIWLPIMMDVSSLPPE